MSQTRDPRSTGPDRRLHGRRRGHRLRKGRQRLLAELLPRLRLDPSAGGGLDPRTVFSDPVRDVWLEIGFGAGEHLAAQAQAHPDIGMIGCEPFVNGVASLLSMIHRDRLTNVRIHDDDARILLDSLADACLGRVFALFSDPWPKKRHHKRRFMAPANLDALARVMKGGAELRFASDHMEYVRWTLGHATRHPSFLWRARTPGDWRRRPDDGYPTRYESKSLSQGSACVYLTFTRRPEGAGGPSGDR